MTAFQADKPVVRHIERMVMFDLTADEGITATGSGEFITKGTERAEYKEYQWGSNNGQPVQRDILRLSYNVNFADKDIQVSTNDTLVVQTRESNKREFYSPKYVKN